MRKFLINLSAFLVLFFILALALQLFLQYHQKNRMFGDCDNLEQTRNINADILLMGSSRCLMHLDPAFFDSVCKAKSLNIGFDGHSEISGFLVRLKNYLRSNKAPAYILLNFDPFISAGKIDSNANLVNKHLFVNYVFFPSKINRELVDYLQFNNKEKYIPLYAIFKYDQFGNYISKPKSQWELYGYARNDHAWDTIKNPVNGELKKGYFTSTQESRISQALKEFNIFCKERNIALICIQTPVYKCIYDPLLFAKTKQICNNLQIPFIDINNEELRNDISNFYNSNHLNKKGTDGMNAAILNDSIFRKIFLK